uniref:Rab-44 (projected from Caenorhabditis elegans ortholog 4R79.2) n=1 Tax=Strongyloides venezuelensis TaxID=75913 RepID=A0A0K0F0F0_STRVS
MNHIKKTFVIENEFVNEDDNTFLSQAEQSKLLHEQALKIFSLCDITNKGFVVPSDLKNLDSIIPNLRKTDFLREIFDKEKCKIGKQKLNQKEFIPKMKKLLLSTSYNNRPNRNLDIRRSSSDIGSLSERRPSKKISFYSTSTGISESDMKEIKFSDSDEDIIEKEIQTAGDAPIYSEHPKYCKKFPTSPGEASLYDELDSKNKDKTKEQKPNSLLSLSKYKLSNKKNSPRKLSTHKRSNSFSRVFAKQQTETVKKDKTIEEREDEFQKESTERIFKVVFVGDSAVGKTCFLQRYCYNQFRQAFNATIGVDFTVKTININDKKVTIQLWDTAGQERFRSITKQYFRKANAVVLMYDITSEKTFINVRNWIESVKKGVEDRCIMCLIGNKLDLCNDSTNREVPYEYGKNLAKEFGMSFYETSAYTRFNVNECIEELAKSLQLQEEKEIEEALKLESKAFKFPGSWCCL